MDTRISEHPPKRELTWESANTSDKTGTCHSAPKKEEEEGIDLPDYPRIEKFGFLATLETILILYGLHYIMGFRWEPRRKKRRLEDLFIFGGIVCSYIHLRFLSWLIWAIDFYVHYGHLPGRLWHFPPNGVI